MSPIAGQCANVPIAGTPPVMSERDPTTTITRKPRKAIAAGVRMPSDTESTALRDASPRVRKRVSVCMWWAMNAPRRAVLDTCNSRSSESCTVRSACARRREARSRRTWNRFENQLPTAARARRGRPIRTSPTASTNPTTNPTGTSHSSLCKEYEVNNTRTRERAIPNSSG